MRIYWKNHEHVLKNVDDMFFLSEDKQDYAVACCDFFEVIRQFFMVHYHDSYVMEQGVLQHIHYKGRDLYYGKTKIVSDSPDTFNMLGCLVFGDVMIVALDILCMNIMLAVTPDEYKFIGTSSKHFGSVGSAQMARLVLSIPEVKW